MIPIERHLWTGIFPSNYTTRGIIYVADDRAISPPNSNRKFCFCSAFGALVTYGSQIALACGGAGREWCLEPPRLETLLYLLTANR
jgi:hypothetical protein